MRGAGWVVAGAVTGMAVSALTAVLAADRGTRARMLRASRDSARWAQETGERWSAGAALARDRVAGTTEELRDRMAESADQWRERRTEEMGRRLLSAAEARDATLEEDELESDDLPEDERVDGRAEGSGADAAEDASARGSDRPGRTGA